MLDSDGMNAEVVHRQRSSGPDFPRENFAKTFAEMNHANRPDRYLRSVR
jgi:hypothetical protein